MSPDQAVAMVQVVAALAEAIRGLGEVPSGTLYAQVMGTLSFEQYESAIALLVRADLVSKRSHVLRWIGPSFEAVAS